MFLIANFVEDKRPPSQKRSLTQGTRGEVLNNRYWKVEMYKKMPVNKAYKLAKLNVCIRNAVNKKSEPKLAFISFDISQILSTVTKEVEVRR